MTLIAYRDGVMAADTALWGRQGTIICGYMQKIRRVQRTGHGGIVEPGLAAGTGSASDIHGFCNWIAEGRPAPGWRKCDDGFQAIVAWQGGEMESFDTDWRAYPMKARFYALGHQMGFLTGALSAGASAEEAVRLAMTYTDAGTSDVQVESIRLPMLPYVDLCRSPGALFIPIPT